MFPSSWKNIDELIRSNRGMLYVFRVFLISICLYDAVKTTYLLKCAYWTYGIICDNWILKINLYSGFLKIDLSIFSLVTYSAILTVPFVMEKTPDLNVRVYWIHNSISNCFLIQPFPANILRGGVFLSFAFFSFKGRSWGGFCCYFIYFATQLISILSYYYSLGDRIFS